MTQRWGVWWARRCVRCRPPMSSEWRHPLRPWRGGGNDCLRTLADKPGAANSVKKWECYFCYRLRMLASSLSPWVVLRKLKVPSERILDFRRFVYKHSYPWFVYSVPIASMMITADILAQLFYPKRCKEMNRFNISETIKYALLAFFVVGPLMSKYDFLTMRKLPCRKMYKLIMSKMVLDTLVLVPLLLALTMFLYDHQYIWCQTKAMFRSLTAENVRRGCCSFNTILTDTLCRYESPFIKIMDINIMTRPLAMLTLCCLVPQHYRRSLRALYEILFLAHVSGTFRYHFMGLSCCELQEAICCLKREREEEMMLKHKQVKQAPPETKQLQVEQRHSKWCRVLSKVFGCVCSRTNNRLDK